MTKKAPQKKKKVSKGRQYKFNFTRKELVLWLGAAFLALVWMFTLGVIVGRGLSPVRFDMEKLKKELIALKEEASRAKKANAGKGDQASPDARHLGFYDLLTDKKEEARLKSFPKSARKDSGAVDKEGEDSRQTAPKTKTAVVNKDKLYAKSMASSQKGVYTLQVASLKNKDKADAMVSTLKKKGYGAYAVTTNVSGKGTYHRVRVGHFTDRIEAVRMASRLKDDKLKPIVIKE